MLADHQQALLGRRLALFTCGLADPRDEQNVQSIRASMQKSLPAPLLDHARIFHLRGGIDYAKLGLMHRGMMAMLHRMVKKKDACELQGEQREMLATYGQQVAFTDQQSIQPILDYARQES